MCKTYSTMLSVESKPLSCGVLLTCLPGIATLCMLATAPAIATLADLLTEIGDIPPVWVRFRPLPGTVTEQDVLDVHV